jgi:hypothetical protein
LKGNGGVIYDFCQARQLRQSGLRFITSWQKIVRLWISGLFRGETHAVSFQNTKKAPLGKKLRISAVFAILINWYRIGMRNSVGRERQVFYGNKFADQFSMGIGSPGSWKLRHDTLLRQGPDYLTHMRNTKNEDLVRL